MKNTCDLPLGRAFASFSVRWLPLEVMVASDFDVLHTKATQHLRHPFVTKPRGFPVTMSRVGYGTVGAIVSIVMPFDVNNQECTPWIEANYQRL